MQRHLFLYERGINMTRLEQRCDGVKKVLDDFNIMYVCKYNTKNNIKICKTKYDIEITNRYITISYKTKHYYNFLPSFTGITEFRKFIEKNGINFMLLESKGE